MKDIFDKERLPPGVTELLYDMNPWWREDAGPPTPPMRRWCFKALLRWLKADQPPIVVLRGPRQVGKTTLLVQMVEALLEEGVEPLRILRVQFDDLPSMRALPEPMLSISRWFQNRILRKTFNEAAREGRKAYILFDEVQNVANWSVQLKHLVDINAVSVMVTGSSALSIRKGQESLAGRMTTIDLGPLLLREVAEMRGIGGIEPWMENNDAERLLDREFWSGLKEYGVKNRAVRDPAFSVFSERGGYPHPCVTTDIDWSEIANYLNESIIERVVAKDLLRLGGRGAKRDPHLLRETFRLACRYAGQAPSGATLVTELHSILNMNVGWQRVLTYLRFLDSSLLIRLIEPLEIRLKKRRGTPKIVLSDHSLRAAYLQEVVPLESRRLAESPELSDVAGHIAESLLGYFVSTVPGVQVAYFPERTTEPEVDFIITIGDKRIPVEVKYRRRVDDFRDTVGLRSFLGKTVYNAPFGLLITETDDVDVTDPRIVTLSLPSFLLLR